MNRYKLARRSVELVRGRSRPKVRIFDIDGVVTFGDPCQKEPAGSIELRGTFHAFCSTPKTFFLMREDYEDYDDGSCEVLRLQPDGKWSASDDKPFSGVGTDTGTVYVRCGDAWEITIETGADDYFPVIAERTADGAIVSVALDRSSVFDCLTDAIAAAKGGE